MTPGTENPPLRVLQSFPEPRRTTNPYVVQLRRTLDALPAVDLRTFTWRRAVLGRYDVLHVHWPEILLDARTPARVMRRRILFLLLLLRLGVTRTAVVRTVHNLRPHDGVSRVDAALLGRLERRARVCIRLNDETPVPPGTQAITVLHGHYRDWYSGYRVPEPTPGRVAFVGLIRPYKHVDGLVAAFRDTADVAPGARLHVAGGTSSDGIAERLQTAAAQDSRITLTLRFLEDAELVEAVGRAQVVALPYREMHNSGAALLALSLGRPVLVPSNATNARLAAEVGADWVQLYEGELTPGAILRALDRTARIRPGACPDLGAREWAPAGLRHLEAYRMARRSR
jgi:glycosyltransferase involved in cell wall biosynthesis